MAKMENKYFEKIIEILDWNKLRFLSCVIVLCSASYHGYFHSKEHKCYDNLLSQYENENSSTGQCLLKNYSSKEVKFCFENLSQNQKDKTVVFVGDAVTRNLYLSFKKEVKGGYAERNSSHWKTGNNSSDQVNFVAMTTPQSDLKKILQNIKTKEMKPSLIVLGFAYPIPEDFKNETDVIMKNIYFFSFDLDLVSQEIPTLWILPYVLIDNESTFLENYISHVKQILKGTHIRIWDMSSISRKGIQKTQVMFNLLCNKYQKESDHLCCSSSYNKKDISIAFIFLVLLIISLVSLFVGYYYRSSLLAITNRKATASIICFKKFLRWNSNAKAEEELPHSTVKTPERQCISISLLIIKSTLIFGYFYLCDRTDFFTKTKKNFSLLEFSLPVFFCLIIGITFKSKASSDKILNREITDEWKGWMQLVILIYHVTGASSYLPIYINVRILVSSYLFMTGFGNFCYYWQGGAMTFRRYCQVMLRMNLLTIVLCVVMQRSYQFYYFVPLVSFWFSIMYGLLLLPPNLTVSADATKVKPSNNDYACVILKFVILFVVIVVISNCKIAFDYIFNFPLWNFIFVLPGDGDHEWWFRWQLDRFSILYGSIFGILYQFLLPGINQENKLSDDRLCLTTVLKCAFGVAMFCSYSLILLFCRTKQECNFAHPFIVSIPILGYILLRNASESLRGIYSQFFTAAGKISLELFICQYHVWLAADTKGRLVLAPGIPLLNITLVSLVFTTIAYEVHELTGHATNLIVVKDNCKIFSNLILLISIVAVCKFFIF